MNNNFSDTYLKLRAKKLAEKLFRPFGKDIFIVVKTGFFLRKMQELDITNNVLITVYVSTCTLYSGQTSSKTERSEKSKNTTVKWQLSHFDVKYRMSFLSESCHTTCH